jgi:YbbR domain-containing protein
MMIYGFDKNEIAVTVKGSNRDIRKYSSEEYKVSVDVGEIAGVGKFTLPLKVTTPSGSSLSLVESEPLNVTLMADMKSTKTVAFDVLVSGIQDAGMIRYSYESEQTVSEIEVSGPKTVMDMISSARFNVNGSFVTTTDEMSFSDFPLMFLDKNFNEVVVDAVKCYGTIHCSCIDIGITDIFSKHFCHSAFA